MGHNIVKIQNYLIYPKNQVYVYFVYKLIRFALVLSLYQRNNGFKFDLRTFYIRIVCRSELAVCDGSRPGKRQ